MQDSMQVLFYSPQPQSIDTQAIACPYNFAWFVEALSLLYSPFKLSQDTQWFEPTISMPDLALLGNTSLHKPNVTKNEISSLPLLLEYADNHMQRNVSKQTQSYKMHIA